MKACIILYEKNLSQTDYYDVDKTVLLTIFDILNMPNNPDLDEVVENYVIENHGKRKYDYFEIDEEVSV